MMRSMVALMCGILLLGSTGPAVALELPPDVLADQYLLEATEALEQGDPKTARWAGWTDPLLLMRCPTNHKQTSEAHY